MEDNNCALCHLEVTRRQEALLCDGPCGRWQHRRCGTGVDRQTYRRALRSEVEISWKCTECIELATADAYLDQHPEEVVDPADEENQDEPSIPNADEQDFQDEMPSFMIPLDVEEPSLLDDSMSEEGIDDGIVMFEVVANGTSRGTPCLVESSGFSYGVDRRKNGIINWRCTKHHKESCRARVRQDGSNFQRGPHSHTHAPESSLLKKTTLIRDLKAAARRNPFQSAFTIAEEMLVDKGRVPNQRPVSQLGRIANRHRQIDRPRHPSDLAFDLDYDNVPDDMLIFDIHEGERRHLLMYTARQLEILGRARRWYVDGTFKVVKLPFTQLWSIHAFARVEDKTKQLPLLYVLMSGKRKQDYRCVLQALKQLLREGSDAADPWKVESVVGDFESSVWRAFPAEFPGIEMRGCSFHWAQAVWRKMQELGLQTFFNADATANFYFRQVLALPYLPAELISGVLRELREEAASDAQRSLLDYISRTWVESTLWPPSTWSVFFCSIRTNNDVEGWHRRLNGRASRGDLNMYLLMSLLAQESTIADMEMQLLRESHMTRRQRSTRNTRTLFAAWDRLIAKERTGRQTLKSVCRVAPLPIE